MCAIRFQIGSVRRLQGQIDVRKQKRLRRLGATSDGTSNRRFHHPLSIGGRLRTFIRKREEGSALVEVALTMPVLLMVMTAICTFAIAFNNQLTLTSSLSSGAQYLQLIRTTTTDPCQDTDRDRKCGAKPGPSQHFSLFNLNGTIVSGSSCAGEQTNLVQGQPITVTAKYPCTLAIYATRFTTGCQLSASVTEYEY